MYAQGRRRATLSFRAVKLLLSMSNQWLAILLGTLFLPCLAIPELWIKVTLFIFILYGLMWIGSVPLLNRREDGTLYEMDGQERAEKLFIERGWWIWRS
jgi:hypothetical protein